MTSKTKKYIYLVTNIIALLCAFILLYKAYYQNNVYFSYFDYETLFYAFLSVAVIHVVKAIRLYLLFWGNKLSFYRFLLTYFKVIPVSMFFPFKLGEIFKIICFGNEINNYLRAVVIVLLDRFIDTLVLLTIVLAISFYENIVLSYVIYLLFFFLLVIALCYLIYSNFHNTWKDILFTSKATPFKLKILTTLQEFDNFYLNVHNILLRRGTTILFLSFISWFFELLFVSSIWIKVNSSELGEESFSIVSYLNSVIFVDNSGIFNFFVFCSVLMLLSCYVILKVVLQVFNYRKE